MNTLRIITTGCAILFLAGCSTNTPIKHIPFQPTGATSPHGAGTPKKFAVFLDGTANDEGSHTNVAKLFHLVTLQADTNISAIYIEGVGTDRKIGGMGLGWGIGNDVRHAYTYLAENYRSERGDEIYIFGFSRGAYAARILAALLHTAGIPNLSAMPSQQRSRYVRDIYDAYKGIMSIDQRRLAVADVLGRSPSSVDVSFLGLWDTIEALGWPDYAENVDIPNPRYADQLCNIRKAAHAVSIDDDRARIFTPILLSRDHLIRECPTVNIDAVVEEVWFSGAHADVGGGNNDTDVDGVSLNWMLGHLAPYGLVPRGSRVYADPYGKTHDPESGLAGLIYRRRNRNLAAYTEGARYNGGALKIHQSVLDRLTHVPVEFYESHWFDAEKYKHCFRHTENAVIYTGREECSQLITVVPYNDVHAP